MGKPSSVLMDDFDVTQPLVGKVQKAHWFPGCALGPWEGQMASAFLQVFSPIRSTSLSVVSTNYPYKELIILSPMIRLPEFIQNSFLNRSLDGATLERLEHFILQAKLTTWNNFKLLFFT